MCCRASATFQRGCRIRTTELLEANGHVDTNEVPFELLARRFSVAHKIKSRHTTNAVLKQAGLPKHF